MSTTAHHTSTSPAASTTAASATISVSPNLKIVGILLAVTSGFLIGSSFVFKKKGLLRAQAGATAGEGVAYLKSPLWWTGMIMMILGELCNFAAYAFVQALVVTPLGALSVVICAILSSIFLKEKLSFFGWIGCFLCIVGSTIIALNGPEEPQVGQIRQFKTLFLAPGFLAYGGVLIAASLVIIFFFAPKYGTKSMLWYISVCSMIGGISVSVTTGLGAAIVTTAMGDNQFNYWFIYFLFVFVAITLVTEVYYLNRALALFNTAMVTPTYYVIFTFCTMVTTVVLFQGLSASAAQILTIVMGFFVICAGIVILQLSKVDPTTLNKLDRRSTILLQAARRNTEAVDEKALSGIEDPGIDALRGSFGAVGSIIRARSARRLSQSSRLSGVGGPGGGSRFGDAPPLPLSPNAGSRFANQPPPSDTMKRHQLYDAPMPALDSTSTLDGSISERIAMTATQVPRSQTIKFGNEDIVHQYGAGTATHERRPPMSPRHAGTGFPTGPSGTQSPGATPRGRIKPDSGAGQGWPRAQDVFEGMPETPGDDSKWYASDDEARSARDSAAPSREQQSQQQQHRKSGLGLRPGSKERRYPRTGGEEDRDESVSLWNRSGASEEDLPGSESVRLVGKN